MEKYELSKKNDELCFLGSIKWLNFLLFPDL